MLSFQTVAQETGLVPWRFCLKGQDADAKEVCFGGWKQDEGPIDPETLEKRQAALQAELERRALEHRLQADQARPAQ